MGYTRVFVAAAAAEMEYEVETILRSIRSLHLQPVTFRGLVPAASEPAESVEIEDVRDSDFFVMLLGQSFDSKVAREYEAAVRHRKPVLMFSKMLKPGESRDGNLTEFLRRVHEQAKGDFTGNLIVKSCESYRRLSELERLVKESLIAEIHRQLTSSVTTTRTRQEMYLLGMRIARAARHRLFVVQQTPILLLGARGYKASSSEKVWYEKDYEKTLMDWIEESVREPGREFVYLYDAANTRAEMEKYQLQSEVKSSMEKLKEKEARSQHRFHLVSMLSKHSGPMTVGDNWFALWVMGEHDAVSISYVNTKVADELVSVLKPAGTRVIDIDVQMEELGLP